MDKEEVKTVLVERKRRDRGDNSKKQERRVEKKSNRRSVGF